MFGIVTATVCVPFFVLIGSLNTTRGMHFWRSRTAGTFTAACLFFKWLATCGGRDKSLAAERDDDGENEMKLSRASTTVHDGQQLRLRRWSSGQKPEMVPREEEDVNRRGVVEPISPAMDRNASSTIFRMWSEERQRQLANTLEV